MVEYIDKEATINAFDSRDEYDDLVNIIREQPAADVQEKRYCKMIPLEPDSRGCTNVFICTNCHQHIHLGFIRKEYSGSYCLECGAKVRDGDTEGKVNELNIKVNRPDGNCLDCKFQYLEDNYYWCSICPGNPEDI